MNATYADPITVHPDRYGARKTQGRNLWAVLHSSEGPEHANAAEQLGAFLGRPGDRQTAAGMFGASYHAIFDTDLIIPAVAYDTVAYSAAGANARGVHGCFPGKADQSRDEWLTGTSREMIRQCAAWLLDLQAVENIPTIRLMPPDLKAGRAGVCDHFAVSLAFRKSSHVDVGIGFPWDVLLSDVVDLSNPTQPILEEDPMLYIAVPAFAAATDATEDIAVFGSGMLRRALNTDHEYARLARAAGALLPVLELTSQDQHADAVARFGRTS